MPRPTPKKEDIKGSAGFEGGLDPRAGSSASRVGRDSLFEGQAVRWRAEWDILLGKAEKRVLAKGVLGF